MTPLSIVIPNWNGRNLLERFLPSVIAATNEYSRRFNAPTEIVIVDDGSVDQSVEYLLGQGFNVERAGTSSNQHSRPAQFDNESIARAGEGASDLSLSLRLITSESNRGFGSACNRGFESARYPLAFLLNNDVEVELNAIAPLVENFADESVFAVHCRVFDLESGRECGSGKLGSFSKGFIRVHRSYVTGEEEKAGSTEPVDRYSMFASGGSAMFNRKRFIEIGGFDNLFAPFYWEDVDISYRAWKRGSSVRYEPRSIVHHRVSSTMRTLNRHRIWRMQQRNRLIYHWVNLHDGRLLASHILWVVFLTITAPLRLQPGFLLSVGAALKRLPQIRKRRREEAKAARRTDRDLFAIFESMERRREVFAYDNVAELEAARSGK